MVQRLTPAQRAAFTQMRGPSTDEKIERFAGCLVRLIKFWAVVWSMVACVVIGCACAWLVAHA